MKGLAPTVNTLLRAIKAGEWADYAGQIQNLGLVSENPAENYVQLPESTQFGDGFTADDYNKLVKELYDGTRTVSNDTEKLPTTKVVKVDDQGAIKG
jgi:basic membrane protein A